MYNVPINQGMFFLEHAKNSVLFNRGGYFMSLKSLICPSCNGELSVEEGKPQYFCPYCGSKVVDTPDTIINNYYGGNGVKAMSADELFERWVKTVCTGGDVITATAKFKDLYFDDYRVNVVDAFSSYANSYKKLGNTNVEWLIENTDFYNENINVCINYRNSIMNKLPDSEIKARLLDGLRFDKLEKLQALVADLGTKRREAAEEAKKRQIQEKIRYEKERRWANGTIIAIWLLLPLLYALYMGQDEGANIFGLYLIAFVVLGLFAVPLLIVNRKRK